MKEDLIGAINSQKIRSIRPNFFCQNDIPWITKLVNEVTPFGGRPFRDLKARFKEPFLFEAPKFKLKIAVQVIVSRLKFKEVRDIDPKIFRHELFTTFERNGNIQEILEKYQINPAEARDLMFADFKENSIILNCQIDIEPLKIVQLANDLVIRSEIFKAHYLQIEVLGDVRRLVRQAKLDGLICEVRKIRDTHGIVLRISGPLALFRQSKLYGSCFCKILAFLPWTEFFKLKAFFRLNNENFMVQLQSGDPIKPHCGETSFDSKLEENFVKTFSKFKDHWDLVREPEPIELANGQLMYPDFKIISRFDPARFWFVEIVGFWTEDYLAKKFESLNEVNNNNWLIFLKDNKSEITVKFKELKNVLIFKRKINQADIEKFLS